MFLLYLLFQVVSKAVIEAVVVAVSKVVVVVTIVAAAAAAGTGVQVNQLDLSAYADELERQGEGKRALQLDSIVEEIRCPYK